MKLSTKARYAITAMMDLALHEQTPSHWRIFHKIKAYPCRTWNNCLRDCAAMVWYVE